LPRIYGPREDVALLWDTKFVPRLGRNRHFCKSCRMIRGAKPKPECDNPEHRKEYDVRLAKSRTAESIRSGRIRQWRARAALHDEVISMLGGKCVKCGTTDSRLLTINHKNGGGRRDGPSVQLYRAIARGKRKTDDLEVMCFNCNRLYEYERGVWGRTEGNSDFSYRRRNRQRNVVA